jgi:hypothetical protein
MVSIFSDLGDFIGSCIDGSINWIIEHTICKWRGHKWCNIMGTYPREYYCGRCERVRKKELP